MTDNGFSTGVFLSREMAVKPEWIDYNGHLNMAYYNVLFDACVDEAFEALGMGESYVRDFGTSFFTAEAHVRYVRELMVGTPVVASFHVLDFDQKRLHIFQELRHAKEGWLSATSENMCLHVDMKLKKVTPFSPDVLSRIKAMHDNHLSIEQPDAIGKKIGIAKKG